MTRWAFMALLLLVPGMAAAQRRLALVELSSAPGMVGLAAEVVAQVNDEARAQGFTVTGTEDLRARLGDDRYEGLRKCGGNAGCAAAQLQGVAVDRVILGSLARDEKSYLVKLWMHAVRPSPANLSSVDRPILIVGRRFKQDVASALPGLLRGEREAQGTLFVTSTTPGATVTVDGEPQGLTPLKLGVKPGKHEFLVELKGYLPVRRFTAVEPLKTTPEDVRLIRVPGEEESPAVAAQKGAAGARSNPSAAPAEDGGGFRVPTGAWVLLGASAAATGVGVYFGATGQKLSSDLAASQDPDTKVYAAARTVALRARSDARIANYCFIGAGAALLAGVIWTTVVATSSHGSDASVHASLSGGPGGGGVLVQGTF